MNHSNSFIQVFLLLLLIVVGPVVDLVATRGLKQRPDSAKKLRYYKIGIASQWLCAALACRAVGWDALFHLNAGSRDARWLLGHKPIAIAVAMLLAVIFLYNFRPAVKCLRTGVISSGVAKYLRSLSFFLPVTPAERRWFTVLCVTAGVCEEILCRGFLFYSIHVWPFQLGLTAALFLSAMVFGFNHLYQGLGGVVNTSIAGVLFGLLFLLSGNLALPMVLHAAIDLQVLILLKRLPAAK